MAGRLHQLQVEAGSFLGSQGRLFALEVDAIPAAGLPGGRLFALSVEIIQVPMYNMRAWDAATSTWKSVQMHVYQGGSWINIDSAPI